MKIIVGASFCHPHLTNQGLSPIDAIKQYSHLGLKHIRLGCYWSMIEKIPGTYDFSELDTLVDACGKLGIQITMTVGMKAPRYPEYYLPSWLATQIKLKNNSFIYENNIFYGALFSYIQAVVSHFKRNNQINYWQIENEPLDPSGPRWWKIDPDLLKREVHLVRDVDPNRPIVINLWGNELRNRNYFRKATELADIVGFDLYPKVPGKNMWGRPTMQGPRDSDMQIREIMENIQNKGKKVWISELQAEPWTKPESCLPQRVVDNASWIHDWGIDGVFFWGFEYWYQQKNLGNREYWASAEKAIQLFDAK